MRERAFDLNKELGGVRPDDLVAGVGVERLLQALDTVHDGSEIDGRQPDVIDARRQVPTERRQELLRPLRRAGDGPNHLEQVSDVLRDAIECAGHGLHCRRLVVRDPSARRYPRRPGTSVLGNAP